MRTERVGIVLLASLIAAAVMAATTMLLEYVDSSGEGAWAMPTYFAGALVGSYSGLGPDPGFQTGPVAAGLLLHALLSVCMGLLFAFVAANVPLRRVGFALLSILFAMAAFVIAWELVLPVFAPNVLRLTWYYFAVGHFAWGLLYGVIVGMATLGPRVEDHEPSTAPLPRDASVPRAP